MHWGDFWMTRNAAAVGRLVKLLVGVCISLIATSALSADWVSRTVGDSWSRVERYVWLEATCKVACEPGRQCEVGSGWMIGGNPRGGRKSLSGIDEIWVLGGGSIYFRASDGQGSVNVAFSISNNSLIGVPIWHD